MMYRTPSYFLPLLLLTGAPSSGQNNILNNGGFESGLMCYTEWIWSYTGVDFAGDYRFGLSSDAHSGAYSMEITCQGADCLRAGIISDHIPAPANRTYNLGLYAKCPAGGTASVYIPWTSTGGTTQYFTCNGNWNYNQVTFQSGSAPGDLYYYIFDYGTQFLRVDDVVLTFADGSPAGYAPLHAGVRNTKVSGQRVLVDGAPYLSLGFYNVPYGDLARVAATGAKTIVGGGWGEADCFNTGQKSYLDTAYELGLNFLPDSTTTARTQIPGVFPNVMRTLAPHLDNLAWVLADEPDLQIPWVVVPPAAFIGESAAARLNTSLPITADFQRASYGTLNDIAAYNGSADIWMAEPYGPDFSLINHAVQLFNSVQPRPIWLAQDDIDASLIVPKAYWAIINGATGIHYFDWVTIENEPDKLAAIEQAFRELKGLNNAIFGTPLDVFVTGPAGIGTMTRYDPTTGAVYIVTANPVASTVQGTFHVQGLTSGQTVSVLNENRWIVSNGGQFSDTFAGVSRHVYQIQTAQTMLTGAIVGQTGVTSNRDWKIQVYNSGLGAARSAQITGLTLTQTGGAACKPVVNTQFPANLGDIAPTQSASGDVLINFNGCGSTATFSVKVGLSANFGATTATVARNNERM